MAKHVRKNPDGSERILSDEEAAGEDEATARVLAALAFAAACGIGVFSLLGSNLDHPLEKLIFVAVVVAALIAGWRFAEAIWMMFFGAIGLGVLWLLGTWILS